ncbi:hypothetical protein [Amycolatopsis sp.]|uniref:hypothetical protein n=1 Tax=Amycolatopsis sp. TaxID=37632 RepID=UPI002BD3A969|nr:hypothetical protein [Amycolatopsis sp.]HVV14541.1 hypothetical protein [Amycolatopsis sp.]
MSSVRMRCAGVTLATAAAFAAGCSQGDGGNGSTTSPSTAAPPSSAAASPSAGAECGALVTSGQNLVTTVGRFVSGQATGDQVRAAATDLSTSIDTARSVIGPQTSARLDDAKAALQRLQTALTAQPADLAGARTAANDTLSALRDAARLCQSGTTSSG